MDGYSKTPPGFGAYKIGPLLWGLKDVKSIEKPKAPEFLASHKITEKFSVNFKFIGIIGKLGKMACYSYLCKCCKVSTYIST